MFKSWLVDNKGKLFLLFGLYCLVTISIGLANHPFVDDASRQVSGISSFGADYARYGSDYAAYLLEGSRHLVDLGLTTFVVSAIILTAVSSILLFVLNDEKPVKWSSVFAGVVIGINPWFMESISFRFDGPYICLSLLFSTLPYLFWKTKYFFPISVVSIFMMYNTYQASSGLYILLLLTLLYKDYLTTKVTRKHLNKMLLGLSAFLSGTFLYFIEMKLNPQLTERFGNTEIAPLSELLPTIVKNYRLYFESIINQSAHIWLVLGCLSLFLFVLLFNIKGEKVSRKLVWFSNILYLFLGFLISYGIYVAVVNPLATYRTRYMYGFAFFLGIILILLSSCLKNKYIEYVKTITIFALSYYFISFGLSYAYLLSTQNDYFEIQSVALAKELSDKIPSKDITIHTNRLLRDSPVFMSALNNYPVLSNILYSNQSLIWPNVRKFNNVTGYNLNFVLITEPLDTNEAQLINETLDYKLYKLNDEFYLIQN